MGKLTINWPRWLRCVSCFAVAAALIASWRVNKQNQQLREANQNLQTGQTALLASANRPILIRGLELPLLDQVEMLKERKTGSSGSTRKLILVYKSACPACERQIPYWEKLVADSRFSGLETWIIAYGDDGTETAGITKILSGRDLAYRVLRVKVPLAFAVTTGIAAVPVTIVASNSGSKSTVELVDAGVASEKRVDLILDAVHDPHEEQGAQFLPPGRTNPL